jgi:soluble lytic murein transglycosylase-like protein
MEHPDSSIRNIKVAENAEEQRKTLKQFLIVIFVLVVLVGFGGISLKQKNNEIDLWKKSFEVCDEALDAIEALQKRLKDIERTLKIAYNLNEFEARYYSLIFDDLSRRHDIPWELIAAVIWIESKYNASAVSLMNCMGLMQLKGTTAEEMCDSVKIDYYHDIVWNDILNLVLGTEYLACDYHKKGLQYVLKKYVGGPKKKQPGKSRRYENWYKGRVSIEFYKLQYVFKGVCADTLKEVEE